MNRHFPQGERKTGYEAEYLYTEDTFVHTHCSNCSVLYYKYRSAQNYSGAISDFRPLYGGKIYCAATQTSAGLVAYTCSVCGASRSERIPPLGLDLTMSGLLENMTGILTACLGWTGVVADGIAENPIFLLIVVTGFIGSGVVLFRRILKL